MKLSNSQKEAAIQTFYKNSLDNAITNLNHMSVQINNMKGSLMRIKYKEINPELNHIMEECGRAVRKMQLAFLPVEVKKDIEKK